MVSSDSSEHSKSLGLQRPKPLKRQKTNQSSEGSDSRQTSEESKPSLSSPSGAAQPKVTVLEQLNFKTAVLDLYPVEETHKGTATTHDSTAPTVITAVLRDLRDDIVNVSDYVQPGPVAVVNSERDIAVIGTDNVYVQSNSKFIPVPREKALSSHLDPTLLAYPASRLDDQSPIDVAVLVQKIFTPLSSVCFGLLGGVALLQLILVNRLVGAGSTEEQTLFLQSYSLFAQAAPLLFYILLAICIISVFDRVPLKRDTIVCQTSGLVAAVYILTLITTLSCASYDDMFTMYHHNKTLFQDQMKNRELVSEWQFLNTLRCVLAIIGWLLFSLTRPDDHLLQHLLYLKQYQHEKHPEKISMKNSYH